MERKETNSLNSPRVLVIRDGWSSQLEVPGYCLFKALEGMSVTTTHFCHNLLVNLGPLPRVVNKFYRLFLRGRRDLVDIYASADKALLEAVTAFAPDVIIAVHALYVRGSVLAAIRKALPRVKIVNWFPDNLFYQCDLLLDAIDQYDIFYVKDSYLLEKLRRCGRSNAAYLPEAGSPTLLGAPRDITDEERRRYSSDLLLVGSLYPYRLYMLEALRGLPLKVYGDFHSLDSAATPEDFFAAQCHAGPMYTGEKPAFCGIWPKSTSIQCTRLIAFTVLIVVCSSSLRRAHSRSSKKRPTSQPNSLPVRKWLPSEPAKSCGKSLNITSPVLKSARQWLSALTLDCWLNTLTSTGDEKCWQISAGRRNRGDVHADGCGRRAKGCLVLAGTWLKSPAFFQFCQELLQRYHLVVARKVLPLRLFNQLRDWYSSTRNSRIRE